MIDVGITCEEAWLWKLLMITVTIVKSEDNKQRVVDVVSTLKIV